jgi:hypothetical protein
MIQKIITVLKTKGYIIAIRPFELNIIGIRNNNTKSNSFDDTINLFYTRPDGQWCSNTFNATTDPGTYWLKRLMNPDGTAILKPGQYINSHRIGVHRKKYQALVQQNPVININSPIEQTGIFGINIHRALINGKTKQVNDHSAGCQVFEDVTDFNLFMSLAHRHKELYGNNFTYTLLTKNDIE